MREWLMQLVAGGKVYWVSDKVASAFKDLSGTTAAVGAALVLVKTMEQTRSTKATYTLDGWKIVVEKTVEKETQD